jgi:LysM repeat protein
MAILTLVPTPSEPVAEPSAEPSAMPGTGREAGRVVPDAVPERHLVAWRAAPARPGTRVLVPASARRLQACEQSHEPDVHGSRLTARGRVVVAAVWLVMIAAAVLIVAGAMGAADPLPTETTTVQIESGDTLWRLAGTVASEVDPRETVSVIMRLNGLDSAGEIHPGDVLVVPLFAESGS